MTRQALIAALCLSLLFNALVLVGFVRARARLQPDAAPVPGLPAPAAPDRADSAPRPPRGGQPHQSGPPLPNVDMMARELKLDDKQRQFLQGLKEDSRREGALFDQSVALVRQSLRDELRKENPDLERLRELVREEADLFHQRRLAEANMYGRFMGELTPEQRRMLMHKMGRRGGGGELPPIPRAIVEKFDANQNGYLDPDEMRQAKQEMARRRRDFQRHAQPPPPLPPQP